MAKISLLLTLLVLISSCGPGPQTSSTQRQQESVGGPENPITPSPPQAGPPPTPPSPPTGGDKDPLNPQICYLPNAEVSTCFDIHDREQVHKAEPLYDYVDTFRDPEFPSGMDKWQYRSPVHLLFSSQHVLDAPLSLHFTRREVLNSNDSRGHYGFFSPEALAKIQKMRETLGRPIVINSGYRSPGYNATLPGAARFSRHTFGDAIDFKVSGVSMQTLAKRCLEMGAGFYQIYKTHVHCDWRTSPLNEVIYGKDLRPSISVQSFQDVQQILSRQLQILAEPLVSEKRQEQGRTPIRLKAKASFQEDSGEVIHEWKVWDQNGQLVKESQSAEPVIPLSKGQYQIQLNWGGSLETTEVLTVSE